MANTEQSMTPYGNPSKPTGEAGEIMLEQMNEHHSEVTEWGISHFDFESGDILLDIGCGGGALLRRIAENYDCRALYGADYSPVSVRKTTEYNKEFIESGRMKIVEASVEALPFDDEAFDKIITVESFYFWPSPAENLKEVRRVLRTGGKFLIVADIYGGAELTESDIENIRKYGLFNPTPEQFAKLLSGAGFREIKINTKDDTTWICAEGVR